jgi:hypothetical protein
MPNRKILPCSTASRISMLVPIVIAPFIATSCCLCPTLLACRGGLFRQIRGGIDAIADLYVEVRQELHLENLRGERVLIDGPRDAVDQLDDQLGHAVSEPPKMTVSGVAAPEERLSLL